MIQYTISSNGEFQVKLVHILATLTIVQAIVIRNTLAFCSPIPASHVSLHLGPHLCRNMECNNKDACAQCQL